MSDKKVVSRTTAIALVAVCVILAGIIVGLMAVYYPPIINGKDNTISSLNAQVSSLQGQVNDLTDTINLTKSVVWISSQNVNQQAGRCPVSWNFSANYAGYVKVTIQTSNSTNIYARVNYASNIISYDYVDFSYDSIDFNVGMGGATVFPILPSSYVQLTVGSTNGSPVSATVSATYYY